MTGRTLKSYCGEWLRKWGKERKRMGMVLLISLVLDAGLLAAGLAKRRGKMLLCRFAAMSAAVNMSALYLSEGLTAEFGAAAFLDVVCAVAAARWYLSASNASSTMLPLRTVLRHSTSASCPLPCSAFSPPSWCGFVLWSCQRPGEMSEEIWERFVKGVCVYPDGRIEVRWNFGEEMRFQKSG